MYNLDTAYLAKLDTPNKAYVLGFLLPKNPVKRLKVYLRRSDSYLLEFIKKEIKYDGPLYRTSCGVCLAIPSKFAKTLIYPDLNFSLLDNFIRGVFDRHGSIIIKGKYLNVTITHDETFLQEFRNVIYKRYGWNTKHQYRCSYNNTMTLMFTGTRQSIEFLHWIYTDSVCLVRKKEIFDDYIKSVYNKVDK